MKSTRGAPFEALQRLHDEMRPWRLAFAHGVTRTERFTDYKSRVARTADVSSNAFTHFGAAFMRAARKKVACWERHACFHGGFP